MIKVIVHGKVSKCTCKKCECQFSYEQEDIKVGKAYNWVLNVRWNASYVVCPDCGKENIVD